MMFRSISHLLAGCLLVLAVAVAAILGFVWNGLARIDGVTRRTDAEVTDAVSRGLPLALAAKDLRLHVVQVQ